MARRQSNNTGNNTNFAPADAFGRIKVKTKGEEKRLPKDIALYSKHFVSEQMIKKAKEHKAKTGEDYEFNLTMTLHVVEDDENREDIEF